VARKRSEVNVKMMKANATGKLLQERNLLRISTTLSEIIIQKQHPKSLHLRLRSVERSALSHEKHNFRYSFKTIYL
jgi:hypothetical protein